MSFFNKEPERSTDEGRRDEVRDEERRNETRPDEREKMRSNPEVQGRTEPRDMRRTEPREEMPGRRDGPGVQTGRPPARSTELDAWPDMRQYRERMGEIHSMFIDDPRKAVVEAERLIDEMVDYIAKSMHEQVRRWHKDVENNADTERLRLMMREFSQMMDRFERRAA